MLQNSDGNESAVCRLKFGRRSSVGFKYWEDAHKRGSYSLNQESIKYGRLL
jgi:hypothetical protein